MIDIGGKEVVIFFFFSSRRRHTRLTCDWSSDVCSSDLDWGDAHAPSRRFPRADSPLSARARPKGLARPTLPGSGGLQTRSEERRVGKECRSRGWPEHSKKDAARAQDRRACRHAVSMHAL